MLYVLVETDTGGEVSLVGVTTDIDEAVKSVCVKPRYGLYPIVSLFAVPADEIGALHVKSTFPEIDSTEKRDAWGQPFIREGEEMFQVLKQLLLDRIDLEE